MLKIDFINVGYGDAVLVREDDGFTMLIDCGSPDTGAPDPAQCRITAADFLQENGIRHLDLAVITHLHIDHTGTLLKIAGQVQIDTLLTSYLPARALWEADRATLAPLPYGMGEYLSSLRRLEAKGCALREIVLPETMSLGHALCMEIDFAHPYLSARQRRALDAALSGAPDARELSLQRAYVNVVCPILTLVYHERRVVLPGDVFGHFWHAHPLKPCYLLKAPHHGRHYSVTERLLCALTPEIIAVSAPSDPGAHAPDPEQIALMQRFAKQVRFTDAVKINGWQEPPHQSLSFTIE